MYPLSIPDANLPIPVLAVRDPSYLIMNCGETGRETGVSGHISDDSHGEPVREWSKEWDKDSGGVCEGSSLASCDQGDKARTRKL